MKNSTPHICVLFNSLGPYHVARLKAAAQVMRISAIDIYQRGTGLWTPVPDDGTFTRRTLFDTEHNQASVSALRSALERVFDELKPDIVAVNGWAARSALCTIGICAKRRIPIILMSESQISDAPRQHIRERVKRAIVSICSAALVGGRTHASYLQTLGMPAERIHTGYDVVDNKHFREGAKRARASSDLRKSMGLHEAFFLTVARMIPKKNLLRLLDAYAAYRAESGAHAWGLVIVGDGPLRETLAQRIVHLNLEDDVHLPGAIQYPDLPQYYGLASAYVHPSTVEPWGLVINEAMAAGLPVLVSQSCGSAHELVDEGRNGWTFDPSTTGSIARCLARCAKSEDLDAMGQLSTAIIENWSPDRFANGLLAASQSAVDAPAPHVSPGTRAMLALSTMVTRV